MSDGSPGLDPFTLPLEGRHLVEASAGTGKTYTLALLYLRCLLERGASVDRILVVTFTNAATEELRARIRGRLTAAVTALETGRCEDAVLRRLLDQAGAPGAALARLRDALLRLDEAAVLTIHGFCARVLRDNAFESATLFDTELVADESELRLGVLEDFWRCRFYGAPPLVAEWAHQRWGSPRGLLAELQPLLLRPDICLVPELTEAELKEVTDGVTRAFLEAAETWRRDGDEVAELLRRDPHLSRAATAYRSDVLDQALLRLDGWLSGEPSAPMPRELVRFTEEALAAGTKKKGVPPSHPFFRRFSVLYRGLETLDRRLGIALVREAYEYLVRHGAERKARDGLYSYDDLLARLAAALQGPGGRALVRRLREGLPIALVDEFQDTDPLQYGIFRRIYDHGAGTALFFIGDPKQAIYGFRGADVFTYMEARRHTPAAGRHSLDTNWRSAGLLVAAVNRLFERAESPFIYDQDIPFRPVRAGDRADAAPLLEDGVPVVPLQLRFARRDDTNCNKQGFLKNDWMDAVVPRACAAEVARLVGLGAAGRMRLGDRPLAPADVAILVRTHRDAQAVQQALRGVGVGGVVMSRESVFASAEAWQLERLVEAVAEAGDPRRLRAALSLDMMGGSADLLYQLSLDEAALEPAVALFRDARRRWLEQGFMAMFMALLQDQGVPARLLARHGGERSLTNLLQLAELLDEAGREHHTMESLLRWLAARRADPDKGAEDEQLRLESDENLVQIVTVHRSKGLEYPVVLIPYPWRARPARARPPLGYHDGSRQCFDLGSDHIESHGATAERERLAEDLRLLYVALTRAEHLCLPFWGYFNGAPDSALAHLLHGPGAMAGMTDEGIHADLAALAKDLPEGITVEDLAAAGVEPVTRPTVVASASPRRFAGHIERRWRVHSYSALVGQHAMASQERLGELEMAGEAPAGSGAPRSLLDFPRGARAGTFFHELLEHLDFPHARGAALEDAVERQLARHGFGRDWLPVVAAGITAVLDTPLTPDERLRLRDIPRQRRVDEMGFHFPLEDVDAPALGRLLTDGSGEMAGEGPLKGLMKGYVDLVFEHEDRYFIVDYKSNHLGHGPGDYEEGRLDEVMALHRYDMQYRLYTLALHRYLARRVAGYAYERHFGGVFYLFLRGMAPATGCGGGVWHRRPGAALVEALDRLVAGR